MDIALKAARVALVGNPNSGKTALFNALTGAHQKVANYAGVTVERKEGVVRAAAGFSMKVSTSSSSSSSAISCEFNGCDSFEPSR